ncbi:MAG: hypothetical protein OEV89_07435 [Desulfobulbaceae bacterium]|nr:hypothetical protein [Desulfobulbaceae bacterium]HIJ90585.1 hypothetical protein [Deltaproteobacteria bacterium]
MADEMEDRVGGAEGSYGLNGENEAPKLLGAFESGGQRNAEPDSTMVKVAASAVEGAAGLKRDTAVKKEVIRPQSPLGVDIGTGGIVIAESRKGEAPVVEIINFFNSVSFATLTKNTPIQNEIPYFEMTNLKYLIGYGTDQLTEKFHTHQWRPVPSEYSQGNEGIPLVEAIMQNLIGRPRTPATPLCFTVPGRPLDGLNTLVYHTEVIRRFFNHLGYTTMSINEGLAVIMSELAENNFTGIGVSIGASMCNVCAAYLAVPLTSFSVQTGGDYIDSMVSAVTGEQASAVKETKEKIFTLARMPSNRLEVALHIYYEDLISNVVNLLMEELGKGLLYKIGRPVPVILSGGVVLPEGFKEMFEKRLAKETRLAAQISSVRLADNPLTAVAKGAMYMAQAEEL